MASQDAPRDDNFIPAALFEIDGSPGEVMPGQIDEATGRVLVLGTGVGSGSVTSVSVVSANGFAGTVATASTTPAITLTTTITGILKGNGTAVSAVTIGSGLAYDGTTLSSTATGDVTKVGTPVNNQVGVWTGDGTLEGDAALTFDTTTDTLTAGILNSTSLTASEIVITDASKNLVSAAVATYPSLTELTYLKGVTSAIQTQLNAKGTGNVTKVGTPANNQIGVWTGDGTIEGDASLTYDGTNLNLATAKNFQIAGATVLADAAGTTTLSNIDAVDATTEATIEAAIDALTSVVLTTPTITTSVVPTTNDGAALGSATNQFSDLFLAEGGVINWDNGDATLTQVGNVLTLDGADLKISTPGTASTSVATIDGTQTLTNKRITKRTGTTTSSATPTINTDNVDEYYITAQTEAITSFTTNLSGTPTLGQTLFISVIGTAARAITWGASFANGPVALPTTTVTTTQLSTLFKWDGSVWRCYATGSTV